MLNRSPNPLHWRKLVTKEMQRLEESRPRGLVQLLQALNDAERTGNVELIETTISDLERFLQAAVRADYLQSQIQTAFRLPTVFAQLTGQEPASETTSALPTTAEHSVAGLTSLSQSSSLIARPDTYWISSATLAAAYAYLTQEGSSGQNSEPEWMLAVTGLRLGAVRTLEHLICIKLASQSFGQASFDMTDFTRVAIELYEHGLALHAIFHSHRFDGPPTPSGTDNHLQDTLEHGGYPAIQAVFSDDGYVRFFARRRPFVVQVFGKGANSVDGHENLFRIVHFSALPHPATKTCADRHGDRLRSLFASARR